MQIDVEKLVKDITGLASLPEIYLRIIYLIDDPSSDLDDFAAVINTDPGLTSSVLKIVNSAFFNFPRQISNISRALNLIGISALHDLVLSVSAAKVLEIPNDIEPLKTFWKRSVYCGTLARLIGKELRLPDTDSLFVIGLLHEIGHIVLFSKLPEQSKQIIKQAQQDNQPLVEVEQSLLGTDYGKLGQALMKEWNLPYKFQCITQDHCHPKTATDYPIEATIVHICHQIAVNKYPGADSYQYPIAQSTLEILTLSEDDLNNLYQQANELSIEIEQIIFNN